jgi:hypothetical protein
VEDRSKDKHTHKNNHDHTNSDVKHVCKQWNYSMELGERGKGKEKDRASVIL